MKNHQSHRAISHRQGGFSRTKAMALLVTLQLAAGSAYSLTLTLTDSVVLNGFEPIGVNLCSDSYYGLPELKKRCAINFEGGMYRQCHRGTLHADGFETSAAANTALTGGTWTVISGPDRWKSGTIASIGTRNGNPFITFDHPLAMTGTIANCGLLVGGLLPTRGHIDYAGTTYDSALCTIAAGNAHDGLFGECAMRMNGSSGQCSYRFQGFQNEATMDLAGAWRVRLWTKTSSGSPSVKLVCGSQQIDLPTSAAWKLHDVTVTVAGAPKFVLFELRVTGGAALVDDIENWKSEGISDASNTSPFRDDFVAGLRSMRFGILRMLRMGGETLRNAIPPVIASYACDISPGDALDPYQKFVKNYGLHDVYQLCETVGAEPWFSLPGGITPQEVKEFMEYLGGPATTSGGKLRSDLGHPTPWTQVFKHIHVEFGNEPNTYAGATFVGPDYWQDLIAEGKKSPYYSDKIKFRVSQVGAATAARYAPNADMYSPNAYRVFNLWQSTLSSTFNTQDKLFHFFMADPWYGAVSPNARLAREFTAASQAGMELAVYEGNWHTTFGDAPLAVYNSVVPSLGGAVAYANGMLAWMRNYQMRHFCFFNISQSTAAGFVSQPGIKLWGCVRTFKPGSESRRPIGHTIAMINNACGQKMTQVKASGVPTFSAAGTFEEGIEKNTGIVTTLDNIPLISAYAFADGTRRGMVIFSLDLSQTHDVDIGLTRVPRESRITWTRLEHDSITVNNEASENVAPRDSNLAVTAKSLRLSIAPHSVSTLVWQQEGVVGAAGSIDVPETREYSVRWKNGMLMLSAPRAIVGAGPLTVRVYSAAGCLVTSLRSEAQSGLISLSGANGRSFSPGSYIVQIEGAHGFRMVKTMVAGW